MDSGQPPTMRLTILSRPGCHLCEEMKAVVARVARRGQVRLEVQEIDISTDADLEKRYRTEIPVLMIDNRKVAKHRLTEAELVRKLESSP